MALISLVAKKYKSLFLVFEWAPCGLKSINEMSYIWSKILMVVAEKIISVGRMLWSSWHPLISSSYARRPELSVAVQLETWVAVAAMCIMCLTHVAMPHYVLSAAKDATSAQFAGVQYRTMEIGFGYVFTTSAWKRALFLSSTMKGFRKRKTMAILLAWMSSGCIHCSMLQSRTILLPLFATVSSSGGCLCISISVYHIFSLLFS